MCVCVCPRTVIDVVGLDVGDVRVTRLLLPIVRAAVIFAMLMSVRSAVRVRIVLVCIDSHCLALRLLARLLSLGGGSGCVVVMCVVVVLVMAVVGIVGSLARAGASTTVKAGLARRHHDQDDGQNHRGEDDPLGGVAMQYVHRR